ncbi:uncharacterized protein LOC130746333 isoform X2 [Lotus japonicus]|uniref:uncharacterized protein LOC130746333 isoform X2 n=1 Tax=Lotus japonicus TaxID=34305 RepID=UPI0025895E89|nr:uncharacterized protein LOC130746333 isoform X2 [Lotus japonicus]
MSQQRQTQMMFGGGYNNDTTFTKLFVGGLAWETQRETMRRYFEQFGEILEAVVITDKNTGRSKGYGFVTFKDPESAMRACQNPSPVIDGRRANCNLASLGANKNPPPTLHNGAGRFRPQPAVVASPAYHGSSSSTFFYQPTRQYTFPYSAYGYSGYSQETMYPTSYYGVYGVQQFPQYYPSSEAGGLIQNNYIYPFYGQYAQNIQAHGYGVQHPQMAQFPFLPQHYGSTGILSLPPPVVAVPTTAAATTTTVSTNVVIAEVGTSQASGTASEQNSTTS